jgi:hypothetical protein
MGCGRDDECRNEKSDESHAREALDHKELAPLEILKQRIGERTPQHGFYGGDRPRGNALERRGLFLPDDRWRVIGTETHLGPPRAGDLAPIARDIAGWTCEKARAKNCRAHFLYQLLLAGIRMDEA